MTLQSLLLSLLLPIVFLTLTTASHAPICSQHPAYNPRWTSVLVKSFHIPHLTLNHHPAYLARNSIAYNLHGSSTAGLDFLHIPGNPPTDNLALLELQRPAKVFLFQGVRRDTGPAVLPGWKSEGYAHLLGSENRTFGLHQKGQFMLPKTAYVFSKIVQNQIHIPSRHYLRRHVRQIRKNIRYHIRIGEVDGTPSPPVGIFNNRFIRPNEICPPDLHRTWAVSHPDTSDSQLTGRNFSTWHPTWDPCFWCAYDHDHGSSPLHLMGYVPKFGYTALKNGKEQEAHEGFKNFVFQQGPYMVYFSLHVQSSHLRRVRERFHTITLVVTNKKTGELLIELSHKADFGFLAARRSTFGFMALTEKDEEMREAQFRPRGERRMRTINVVDMGHLDRRFKYRHNPMEGVYEAWTTATICSSVPPHGEITMDIKNPVTGVRNVYDKVLKPVVLGSSTVNVATSRNLRIGGIEISAQHCKFDNYGGLRGGWFYTDAYGKNVLSGPGTNAIRQYIKPGMRISLNGNFELGEDVWAGLFEHNKSGFFMDHGFGVDPMQN